MWETHLKILKNNFSTKIITCICSEKYFDVFCRQTRRQNELAQSIITVGLDGRLMIIGQKTRQDFPWKRVVKVSQTIEASRTIAAN